MKDTGRMKDIIASAVNVGNKHNVPITIKTRLGWDHENINSPLIAKMAQGEGVQMITIHGRTRAQMFNGCADWEAIKAVKDAVSIPVIANGDICNEVDVVSALIQSGCDGVMIGRASRGAPWLLNKLHQYIETGIIINDPTDDEKEAIIIEHMQEIICHYGEEGASNFMKKHLSWYCKGFRGASDFRSKINTMFCAHSIMNELKIIFL